MDMHLEKTATLFSPFCSENPLNLDGSATSSSLRHEEFLELSPISIREKVLNGTVQDLLYVGNLPHETIVKYLWYRYKNSNYFTYFGNVLFYLMPVDHDALELDYSRFLYANNSSDAHLFGLLNEILASLISRSKLNHVDTKRPLDTREVVCNVSNTRIDGLKSRQACENYNIFIYGDSNFSQLHVAQHVVRFISQASHIIGLEPSGVMSEKISTVHKLMEQFNDYSSHDELFHNYMITYKFNFDELNLLSSVTLIPNLATDTSCGAVSHRYRSYLEKSPKTTLSAFADIRFPTVFYSLMHTTVKGHSKEWFFNFKLSAKDASYILDLLPKHKIVDQMWHVRNFHKIVDSLLKVGFSEGETNSIVQLLCAILLFDVYSLLKVQKQGNNGKDLKDEYIPPEGNSAYIDKNSKNRTKIMFRNKDLLGLIFDILDIGILKKSSSKLKSSDILFKVNILSAMNQWQFEYLSTAIFIRLKYLIYKKINSFLTIKQGSNIKRSISLHCNGGNFPQSLSVNETFDVELPKRFSEEAYIQSFMSVFGGVIPTASTQSSVFLKRNDKVVSFCTHKDGPLTKIILASQDYVNNKVNYDKIAESFGKQIVAHSWGDVEYDIPKIIEMESTIYSIPDGILRLFKYSENNFILNLIYSKQLLYPAFGNCSAAMSYYMFLNESISPQDSSYFVVCSCPSVSYLLYSKDENYEINDESSFELPDLCSPLFDMEKMGDRVVYTFSSSLTKNIPILDMCIMQRDYSKVSLELSSFVKSFLLLAYTLTKPNIHRFISLMDDFDAAEFLFRILGTSNLMYTVGKEEITMQKSLYIKIVTVASSYVSKILNATKVIQRWWIGYNILLLRRMLRKLVIRIQSRVRCQNSKRTFIAAASGRKLGFDFFGLVLTISYLNISLLSSSHRTLQLLHSMERKYHEKEYNYLQYAAATYIQSCWKGFLQRRRYALIKHDKFEEFAIVLVQSAIRRLLANVHIINRRPARELASTKIQSFFRGYLTRCRYEILRGLKLSLLSIIRKGSRLIGLNYQLRFLRDNRRHHSTALQMKRLIIMQTNLPSGFTKAQNLVRMWFVRKQYIHLKGCIEKVQAIAMTKIARLSYLKKVSAAKKIQSWWRYMPKGSTPSILTNSLYYINLRESTTLDLLREALAEWDIKILDFTLYQDIRHIYPKMWAMIPFGHIEHIKQIRRSVLETGWTEFPSITGVDFAIGATHSLLLVRFSNGESSVYSWGWNDRGALGRVHAFPLKTDSASLALSDALEFNIDEKLYHGYDLCKTPMGKICIISVACGNDFSLALTKQGQLFSWGDNSCGQCGHGHHLIRVLSPLILPISSIISISAAESHSIVLVSTDEYLVFGKAFGRIIYVPEDVKLSCPHLKYQTIKDVQCCGSITVLYTAELDYVLNIFGFLHNFLPMYNLRGKIQSICTNGRMICAIVETPYTEENLECGEFKILIWGHVRCILENDKSTSSKKALLVSTFREQFENVGKPKPRRSVVQVDTNQGKVCFVPFPTEVIFAKNPKRVMCDNQQIIVITANDNIFGMKLFQIPCESASDVESTDDFSISLKNYNRSIKLDPALYQFVNLKKVRDTVKFSFNRLSCSIGYAT